jgi:hypothetical protein
MFKYVGNIMEEALKFTPNNLLRNDERIQQSMPEGEVAHDEIKCCGFDWKKEQARAVNIVNFPIEAALEAIAEKVIVFFAQPIDPKLTVGIKQEKQKRSWDALSVRSEQLH